MPSAKQQRTGRARRNSAAAAPQARPADSGSLAACDIVTRAAGAAPVHRNATIPAFNGGVSGIWLVTAMQARFEYEDATRLYRKKVTESDRLFRLAPLRPSAALSHCDDETWYLCDDGGRLIARVNRGGVLLF